MAFDNGITLTANSKKTKHKFKNQEINFDPRFHSNLTIFFFQVDFSVTCALFWLDVEHPCCVR